jgi:hypothetical protein
VDLIQTNGRRNRGDMEHELLDTLPCLKSIEINTWGLLSDLSQKYTGMSLAR